LDFGVENNPYFFEHRSLKFQVSEVELESSKFSQLMFMPQFLNLVGEITGLDPLKSE
jgi:hypothetical protein